MKLLARVQQPLAGPYQTVEFDYSPGTQGLDFHRELCRIWGSDDYTWAIQGQDIRELTPGYGPWKSGALFSVSSLASNVADSSSLEEQALFTLSVVHGPDSHVRFPLARGSWEIGRQASLLKIDDPALAPLEGFIEVAGSGVYFVSEGSRHELEIGKKFMVGDSVLVLDREEHCAPLYYDPTVQEIDVPAPKSTVLMVAMVALPLVLGLVIAWFTQLWLVLLMACGSSLLMGLHAFARGNENASLRRHIEQCAHMEEEAIGHYRGADKKQAAIGVVIGRGTRPLRIKGKQREVGRIPEVQGAPYVIGVDELAKTLHRLPVSTQRLALYQLLAEDQPVYVLLQEKEETWFLGLIDPLLATDNVYTVALAELTNLPAGLVVCSSLPVSVPPHLLALPLADSGTQQNAADLIFQSSSWQNLVFDGISEERYCTLLANLPQRIASFQSKTLGAPATHTSQIPLYALPDVEEATHLKNLWATEIFLHVGKSCESKGQLQLGLMSHGPHFLCAGTTGSGKSQLIRSLLWSAALAYPPQRLAFVLIDFKGGAGLGPLTSLPHCSSLISDLDTSQLIRTMKFLRADITHRKQVWKSMGISSYNDYIALCEAAQTIPDYPELIICIDEFRMLVDEHPDIMNEIMKIATIGRSLGYHLILATQRPQGAISPDIRANISTVLCLRVSSAQESFNVLGAEDASLISARAPGRGLLRSPDNHLIEFQAPLITGPYKADPDGYCRARFVLNSQDSQQLTESKPWSDAELDAANASIYRAYRDANQLPSYRPIPPMLVSPRLTDVPNPDQPYSLLLGQYEIPELGLQAPLIWSAENGPMLLQGASTEWIPPLRVTILQALGKGYAVLCLTPSEQRAREMRLWGKDYPQQLEVFTYQDFNYVQYLLACCADSSSPGQLLIVDTLETMLDHLQRYPEAETHLHQVLALSERPKIQVFCTSITGVRGKYQQAFEHTIVTRTVIENDPIRTHSKDYTLPGSGQFALEGKSIYDSSQGKVRAGTLVWAEPDHRPVDVPSTTNPVRRSDQLEGFNQRWLSWRPLPLVVPVSALPTIAKPHAGALACGIFKDGSTAFTPPLRGGFMSVSGPQGSGKTWLLRSLVQANPERFFIVLSSSANTKAEDVHQALAKIEDQAIRPILLIDDIDQLSHNLQQTILAQKDAFDAVIVTYTPWPRWSTSPILAALNGTATGILLNPCSPADMSFYPGVTLPQDLRTHGQLPPGRGVIINHASVKAFQAALPEDLATRMRESDNRE